ncbi:MAG: non-canonical purine NTP pyrophosphatase [Patescibacteria group bacterium]|jgi:XTP/dITP diphosphohydrolase
MQRKIILATNSFGKIQEISSILGDLPITCVTPKKIGLTKAPEETGQTLAENALIKAKFYADKTGLIALADDSSLEIDALQGEPGIYVRRWPGYEATDSELISYCLDKMKDYPNHNRGAQFHSVICIYDPTISRAYYFEGITRGMIAPESLPKYIDHYPFDALFYFPDIKKYLAEIRDDKELESSHSHRTKAVRNSIPKIKELFNI